MLVLGALGFRKETDVLQLISSVGLFADRNAPRTSTTDEDDSKFRNLR